MVAWASLITTAVAPASYSPATAAFTSEVSMARNRCHCSVPGCTSAGHVTPVAPSMSAEITIFMTVSLPVIVPGRGRLRRCATGPRGHWCALWHMPSQPNDGEAGT